MTGLLEALKAGIGPVAPASVRRISRSLKIDQTIDSGETLEA